MWTQRIETWKNEGKLMYNFNYSYNKLSENEKTLLKIDSFCKLSTIIKFYDPETYEKLLYQDEENLANDFITQKQQKYTKKLNFTEKFGSQSSKTIKSNSGPFEIKKVVKDSPNFWKYLKQEIENESNAVRRNYLITISISKDHYPYSDISLHEESNGTWQVEKSKFYINIHPGWKHLIDSNRFGSLLFSDISLKEKATFNSIYLNNGINLLIENHYPSIKFKNNKIQIYEMYITLPINSKRLNLTNKPNKLAEVFKNIINGTTK